MTDISNEILNILKKNGIETAEINNIAGQISEALAKSGIGLQKGIRDINDKIQQTKMDVAAGLPEGTVTQATEQLDEVVKSTEEATHKILDAAEDIQNICSQPDSADKIMENVTKIFEACNFQDLIGQRVHKVTQTLSYIEQAIGGMISEFPDDLKKQDTRPDADLLNGPQNDSQKPNQGDVDKLFDSI